MVGEDFLTKDLLVVDDEAFSMWQPRYNRVIVLLVTDNLVKNLREVDCNGIGRSMSVSMIQYN